MRTLPGEIDTQQVRFRALRAVAIGTTILMTLVVIAAVLAPVIIRGPRFGRVLERMLPQTQGQIHVGGGRWTWTAVLAWARGRPAPFELEDIRITDPEGVEVLRVARISGRVARPPSAVAVAATVGTVATVIDGLRVETARWRVAEMKRGGIGFLAALEPRAPSTDAERHAIVHGGSLTIRNARLEGVDATFDSRDWGLILADVHATASLSVSAGDQGQTFAFDLRNADARSGGRLRILGGDNAFSLPFSRGRLDRVATTADAPDAIRLEASGVTTGTSILALAGTFTGVYGVSRPKAEPGIDLHAEVSDAVDAIRAVAAGRNLEWPAAVSGRGARLALGFVGPFAHLRIDAQTFLPSPDGGSVDGDLSLDEHGVAVDIAFTRFATTPLLPAPLVALAGGTLEGTARGRFDVQTTSGSLERMELTLTRSAEGARPRVIRVRLRPAKTARRQRVGGGGWELNVSGARFSDGTLRLPRLTAGLWGGRLSASGQIRLTDRDPSGAIASPKLDLTLNADRVSSTQLFGAGFVDGDVSFRARARGSLDDMAVDIVLPSSRSVRVIGERVHLPDHVSVRLRGQDLLIPTTTLNGPRHSTLTLRGRINMNGRLALDIGVNDFPFDRLPGLAQTTLPLAGLVSGRLALSGDAGQRPAFAGQFSFDPVTFQGRHVGGGLMTISPGARGAIHAQGRLVEGIEADGTLLSEPGGLTGNATLTLRQLRLDPFLASLPGGVTATGLLSGTITAHIAPGQSPRAEGRLSQLTLTVTPPATLARSNKAVRPLDLHSEGDILLSAQTGAGPIHIGPARFAGNFGSFELEGESKGDSISGALRGRVLLDAFAPVTAAWVDHLTGALEVQLRAAQAGERAPLLVKGEISIAAPVSGRARALPFATRIPSGRFRLLGDAIETSALPVTFESGRQQVNLTIGPKGGPPGRVEFDAFDGLRIARADLPLRGELRAIQTGDLRIDRASFGLRLQGRPRQPWLLAGDIEIADAHAPSAIGRLASGAAGSKTSPRLPPELEQMQLDLRVHANPGAVEVDVRHVPDLRVGVDYHVGGTLKHPDPAGHVSGAGVYSTFILWLGQLL